jgi:transposase
MLGVGERGIKTDQRDARALSQSSCRVELPSIHIRSKECREHLARLGMRASMITSRTQLTNTVRGWLRAELITVKSTTACFPNNVRKHFAGIDQEIPSYVDHLLICIEELNQKITEADTEIESAAKDDPVCVQLMSVPGVGPITSLCYNAVVDVADWFPNAHSAESYLGLTPGEKSSSFTVRRTSITKAGPAMMRHYLTQASLSLRRLRPNEPISRWVAKIAGRRGKQVATIATARKLAGILFAMWRDGTNYAPSKAASVKALEESTTH